jgi:hypothetical protein
LEPSLNSLKCTTCGLVNFATSEVCRRCATLLAAHQDALAPDSGLVPPTQQSSQGGRSFGRWVIWVLGVLITILTTAYASLLLTSEPLTDD